MLRGVREASGLTPKQLLGRYSERAFWTALQTFLAVVIVGDGFSARSLAAGGVAAGLAVINNVILPLAAKRRAILEAGDRS